MAVNSNYGPPSAAIQAFNTAQGLITQNLASITGFGNSMKTQLDTITDNLSQIELNFSGDPIELPAPEISPPERIGTDAPVLPPLDAPTGMEVTPLTNLGLDNLDVSMDDLPPLPDLTLAVNLPDAPGNIDTSGMPSRPPVDFTVALPDDIALTMPEIGNMLAITVPEFVFPELPDFNATPPTVDFPVPNPMINWAEPEYASEVYDEVASRIKEMLQGGTGLPKEVEQALFDRARQREDQAAAKQVAETFEAFAAKNFTLPPGALVKQVAMINEQNRLKAAEINRDILAEAAKYEIENLRHAVEKGITLEGLTMNLFENAAKRTFEVAKFYADAQIKVFDAQITLFNSQNQAFQTLASVYKTKLDGALSKLQAYKTAADAQLAIGQLNEQTVKVFTAKLQGLTSQVEIYKAKMGAAQIRSELIKTQLDAYRTDVQAFAEKISAEKVKFDAYKAQIEGETAKVGVVEGRAKAYAATIQGFAAKADVKVKNIQAVIEAAKAKIVAFQADVEAQKAKLQGEVSVAAYKTEMFKAEVEGFKAKMGAEQVNAELGVKVQETITRTNISTAEMAIKKYEVDLTEAIKRAEIAMEGLKAAGGYTAQLAAGAMSALHMSASISGSGAMSDTSSNSFSQTTSNTTSESTNHNYNY